MIREYIKNTKESHQSIKIKVIQSEPTSKYFVLFLYLNICYVKKQNFVNWFYLSVMPDRDLMDMEERFEK